MSHIGAVLPIARGGTGETSALALAGNSLKVIRVNAGETGFELATSAADLDGTLSGTSTIAALKVRTIGESFTIADGGALTIADTGRLVIP